MPGEAYVWSQQDAARIANTVRVVERGGLEHPFHRARPPVPETRTLIGKADANVTAGNTGTFSLWTGTAAGSLSDSGANLDAYARMGDVTSGNWVYLALFDSGWEVIMTEC